MLGKATGDRSVAAQDASNATLITGDIAGSVFIQNSPLHHPNAALRAYLSDQFHQDRNIRFKQANLDSAPVQEMFVDVPFTAISWPVSDTTLHARSARMLSQESRYSAFFKDTDSRKADIRIAEALLLDSLPARVEISAGPGRGKSTILQFVSQVFRAHVLRAQEFLDQLPRRHRPTAPRWPFRIDLRDFATWINGIPPYDENTITSRALESYIASQVRQFSGGLPFTVSDFEKLLTDDRVLVALDGLDEIASIELRARVVEEIDRLYGRHRNAHKLSLVITTRPSANPAAPQLTDCLRIGLGWLPTSVAQEYVTKWTNQWRLTRQETDAIRVSFSKQAQKSYISDLQQSIMHLSILLFLLRTLGESLPKQRTRLYQEYIRIYLDRESAKTPAVREQRQLLEEALGHIAWELHAAAEVGGAGRATSVQLDEWLHVFLRRIGGEHLISVEDIRVLLVDRLRILEGPIEGLYEFETQPMREYFVAKHLDDTPPTEREGAYFGRLQRFSALAKRPHWTNVARFFVGFFHPGELTDLIESFIEEVRCSVFGLTSAPRALLGSIIHDHTLAIRPRAEALAASFCLDALGVRLALGDGLSLEALSGSGEVSHPTLARVLTDRIEADPGSMLAWDAARLLPRLSTVKGRGKWWTERADNALGGDRWLAVAATERTLEAVVEDELDQIAREFGVHATTGKLLLLGGARARNRGPACESMLLALKNRFVTEVSIDQGLPGRMCVRLSILQDAALRATSKDVWELAQRLVGDSWAGRYIAILWARKQRAPHTVRVQWPFGDLVAGDEFARCISSLAHGTESWWKEQLALCESPLERVTWLVSLCALGSADVIGGSLDTLGEVLWGLPSEWARVAAADARSLHTRLIDLRTALTGVGSDRGTTALLLFGDRLTQPSRRRAIKLTSVNADVLKRAEMLGDWASEYILAIAFAESRDFSFRSRLGSMVDSIHGGTPSPTRSPSGLHSASDSVEIGVKILRAPLRWPIETVVEAEALVTAVHAPEPLANVAPQQGWFNRE